MASPSRHQSAAVSKVQEDGFRANDYVTTRSGRFKSEGMSLGDFLGGVWIFGMPVAFIVLRILAGKLNSGAAGGAEWTMVLMAAICWPIVLIGYLAILAFAKISGK